MRHNSRSIALLRPLTTLFRTHVCIAALFAAVGLDGVAFGQQHVRDTEYAARATHYPPRTATVIQPSQPGAAAPAGPGTSPAARRTSPQRRWSWPKLRWPEWMTSWHRPPATTTRTPHQSTVRQPPVAQRRTTGWDFREPVEQWPQPLDGDLIVGYRLTSVSLTDGNRSGTDPYYGHVIGLDEDNGFMLLRNLYADWYFTSWRGFDLGCGAAWSFTSASTENIEGHSDGSIEAGGPVLTAIAQYPFRRSLLGRWNWTIAPSAGIGLVYLSTDFDHAAWWHYGFGTDIRNGQTEEEAQADYEDWVGRGSPEEEIDHTRTMDTDNAMGWVFQTGVRASHGPVGFDLFLRYMNADIDATYTQDWGDSGSLTEDVGYPLSSWTYGLGASYAF